MLTARIWIESLKDLCFSNSGPCDGRKRSSPVVGQWRGLRVIASAPSWELLAKGSTPVRLQLVVGQVDKPTSSSVSSFATIAVLGLEAGPQMQQWPLECSELERDCWWLGGLNRQNVWPTTKFRSGGGLAGHPSENRFGIGDYFTSIHIRLDYCELSNCFKNPHLL